MADTKGLTFLDDDLDDELESAESIIPSVEEAQGINQDDMGVAEAAVTSFGQGASLGLAPIVSGIGGAAQEVGGDLLDVLGLSQDAELEEKGFDVQDDYEGLEGLMQAYYDMRDKQIAAQEKSFEDQPAVSLAANIAGSIPTTIASGGLANVGGKAANLASKVLPRTEDLSKLSTAAKAGKMAIEGAKAGGLAGFGSGESKLLEGDVLDTIAETGASSVGGAVVGSAFPVAAKGLSKAKNAMGMIPGLEALKTGVEAGRKGINITDDESVARYIDEATQEIRGKISKAFGGQTKKELLDELDNQGARLDLKELIESTKNKIKTKSRSKEESTQLKSLLSYLEDLDKDVDTTLQKAMQGAEKSAAGKLNKLKRQGQEIETRTEFDTPFDELSPLPENQGRVIGVQDNILMPDGGTKKLVTQKSILEGEIPIQEMDFKNLKISEADELASGVYPFGDPTKYTRNVNEIAKDLRKGITEEITAAVNGSLGEKNQKLSNVFNSLRAFGIDKNKFMSSNPEDQREVLEKIIQAASADRNSSKGRAFAAAMKYLGQADEAAIQGMQESSDFLTRLTNISGQYDASGSTNIAAAALGAAQKGFAKVGNIGALAAKSGSKELGKAKNAIINVLKDATPDDINQLSNKLLEKYGESVQPFVNQLAKAVNAPDNRKTALLFGIYQQPSFRKAIEKIGRDALMMQQKEQDKPTISEPTYEGLNFLDEDDNERTPQGTADVVDEEVVSDLIQKEGDATFHSTSTKYQGLTGPKNTRVEGSSDQGLYYDSLGKLTAGYGDLVTSEEEAQLKLNQSKKQAIDELMANYENAKSDTISLLGQKGIDPELLSGRQLSGLYDMVFQLGINKASKFKKMFEAIKNNDFEKAAKEAQDSNWYNQTPTRVRELQKKLLDKNANKRIIKNVMG